MKYEWEVTEDAYNKRLRYVEYPSGNIRGYVSGCNFNGKSEWAASKSGGNSPHIGNYVTEGLAKNAVEKEFVTAE